MVETKNIGQGCLGCFLFAIVGFVTLVLIGMALPARPKGGSTASIPSLKDSKPSLDDDSSDRSLGAFENKLVDNTSLITNAEQSPLVETIPKQLTAKLKANPVTFGRVSGNELINEGRFTDASKQYTIKDEQSNFYLLSDGASEGWVFKTMVTVERTYVEADDGIPTVDEYLAKKKKQRPKSTSTPKVRFDAPKTKTTKTLRADSPYVLVQKLEFAGLKDGLGGKGWHRSNFDGKWNAVLNRQFGANEVSCLIESSNSNTIDRVQLEAEIYEPGVYINQILLQFTKALAMIYPEAPSELIDAIANQKAWSNNEYRLTRERYPNGGYELRLKSR